MPGTKSSGAAWESTCFPWPCAPTWPCCRHGDAHAHCDHLHDYVHGHHRCACGPLLECRTFQCVPQTARPASGTLHRSSVPSCTQGIATRLAPCRRRTPLPWLAPFCFVMWNPAQKVANTFATQQLEALTPRMDVPRPQPVASNDADEAILNRLRMSIAYGLPRPYDGHGPFDRCTCPDASNCLAWPNKK